jgi:hypothetical protein
MKFNVWGFKPKTADTQTGKSVETTTTTTTAAPAPEVPTQRTSMEIPDSWQTVGRKLLDLLPLDGRGPGLLPHDGKGPDLLPHDGKGPDLLPHDGKGPDLLPHDGRG